MTHLKGNSFYSHVAVFSANLLYGANYSIAKMVMPAVIKPYGFIVLRVWTAALLFVITAALFRYPLPEKRDRKFLALCTLFGVVMNQILFFKGLSLTSPINSGLIMVTNPVFVMILSAIFLKERISGKKIIGLICGIAGATWLIVAGASHANNGNASPLGDILVLLNSLSFALFLVMIKPYMKKYHPLTIMQFTFLVAMPIVFPVGFHDLKEINTALFTPTIIAATLFVLVGTTYLAYLFNSIGLKNLSPSVVSIYIYMQPLLAAVFAMFITGDTPQPRHLFSAVLLFLAVFLTTTSSYSTSVFRRFKEPKI